MDVIQAVDLQDTLFEIGMRSAVPADRHDGLPERILPAREVMRQRLSSPALSDLVERSTPAATTATRRLGENLLFGTPVGRCSTSTTSRPTPCAPSRPVGPVGRPPCRSATSWPRRCWNCSATCPGHELFERFSFIAYDDLPAMKEVVAQVGLVGLERLSQVDRSRLLGLPLLIVSKHRLGLIDDTLEARVLDARRRFAEGMLADMRDAIEFFDPARFNGRHPAGQHPVRQDRQRRGWRRGADRATDARDPRMSCRCAAGAYDRDGLPGGHRRRSPLGTGSPEGGDRGEGLAAASDPAVVLDQAAAVLDPRAQERIAANILAMRMLQG